MLNRSTLIPDKKSEITDRTVGRLVAYRRLLVRLQDNDVTLVSSKAIGDMLGIKSSQVRKDLSYLGEFGKRGVGYNVGRLLGDLTGILAPFNPWQIGLVGMGRLGEALIGHSALWGENYEIVCAFDNDDAKVGTSVFGKPCYHVNDMARKIEEYGIGVLIIAVPSKVAQRVLDLALDTGQIIGVLNFSAAALAVPPEVELSDVDISVELEKLLFRLKLKEQKKLLGLVESMGSDDY